MSEPEMNKLGDNDSWTGPDETHLGKTRIKYFISLNLVGSTIEDFVDVDPEDWDEMTNDEKDEFVKEQAFQELDWGYFEEKES